MANDCLGILRPSNRTAQKTIIVLGAPRGGTSMVAATLRKLGVMMGDNLGHQHEDPNFRQDASVAQMLQTIALRNERYDVWGWKLPNSVYYVEELLPALRNPHFVAIFRNPYSISRSSAERDGRIYGPRLLQVAVRHTRKVVDLIARLEAPTALASFETAFANREPFVRGLADFVGVRDEQKITQAIHEGINTELNYTKF